MSLSNRQSAWLDVAAKLAEDSTCRMQHGAIIVRGNSILGVGTNKFRNHPKWITDYSNCSRHAEIVALRNAKSWHGDEVDLSRCTIYVARVGSGTRSLMSRPCDACWEEIVKKGIRNVVYTTNGIPVAEKWSH